MPEVWMPTIATVTMNPRVDLSYEVNKLIPTRKIYGVSERIDPGGGGINVARVFTRLAVRKGIKMALDTSGAPLREGLAGAPVHFLKPNVREFSELIGGELTDKDEVIEEARQFVTSGQTQVIVVTMDVNGAVLATAEDEHHMPAIEVPAKSAIGAGDSQP